MRRRYIGFWVVLATSLAWVGCDKNKKEEAAANPAAEKGQKEGAPAKARAEKTVDYTMDPEFEKGFEEVLVSMEAVCARRVSGAVECFKAHDWYEPKKFAVPEGKYVELGQSHAICGLTEAGEVKCWGNRASLNQPKQAGPFETFDLGSDAGCGVKESGELECWSFGDDEDEPEAKAPEGKFLDVAVGTKFACGLRDDGDEPEIGDIECWGNEHLKVVDEVPGARVGGEIYAEEGDLACVTSGNPKVRPECWGTLTRKKVPPRAGFTDVVIEGGSVCGRTVEGGIECWMTESAPSQLAPLMGEASVRDFDIAAKSACIIAQDGTLKCNGTSVEIPEAK